MHYLYLKGIQDNHIPDACQNYKKSQINPSILLFITKDS